MNINEQKCQLLFDQNNIWLFSRIWKDKVKRFLTEFNQNYNIL